MAAGLHFMLLSFLVFYLISDDISTQSGVLTSYEVPKIDDDYGLANDGQFSNIYNLCLQNRVSNCQVKRSLKCDFSLLISRFAVRDIVCLAFPVRLVVTDLAMYMDFLSSPGFGLLCKCKMSDEADNILLSICSINNRKIIYSGSSLTMNNGPYVMGYCYLSIFNPAGLSLFVDLYLLGVYIVMTWYVIHHDPKSNVLNDLVRIIAIHRLHSIAHLRVIWYSN